MYCSELAVSSGSNNVFSMLLTSKVVANKEVADATPVPQIPYPCIPELPSSNNPKHSTPQPPWCDTSRHPGIPPFSITHTPMVTPPAPSSAQARKTLTESINWKQTKHHHAVDCSLQSTPNNSELMSDGRERTRFPLFCFSMEVERSNPCDSQQSKGPVARICNPYTPQWQRMNVFKKLQQNKTLIDSHN